MYVDGIVALSLVGCCLVFFLVVALFSALFHRSLGTAQIPKSSEKNDLETQDNATIPLVTEDAQLEYTTEIVQPEDTSSAHGYPHYEVCECNGQFFYNLPFYCVVMFLSHTTF